MKFLNDQLGLFIIVCTLSLAPFKATQAMQCKDVLQTKTQNQKTYDKVLKSYLMVNLTYPQIDSGVSYLLIGLLLSGEASYQEVASSIYNAPKDKLDLLYTSMTNSHAAHGVNRLIPFSRIVKLTKGLEQKVNDILLTTLSVLLPEVVASAFDAKDAIEKSMNVLSDASDPRTKVINGYGAVILKSLRDRSLFEHAKTYRKNFRDGGVIDISERITRDQMSQFLKATVKMNLEEAFPETKKEVTTLFDEDARPLSETIGVYLDVL